jgi:hypothetical protein
VESNNVKCPNCGHVFDGNEAFWWGTDENGHPTVENIRCPRCSYGTESLFECGMCPGQFDCNRDETCPPCMSGSYESFAWQDGAPSVEELPKRPLTAVKSEACGTLPF